VNADTDILELGGY